MREGFAHDLRAWFRPGIRATGYESSKFAIRQEAPDYFNRAALLVFVAHRAVGLTEA